MTTDDPIRPDHELRSPTAAGGDAPPGALTGARVGPGSRITRRRFLTGLGAAGTLAAGGYAVSVWARDGGDGARRASSSSRPTNAAPSSTVTPRLDDVATGRTLVVLELGGGNDGLSFVVPHADRRYRDLRPTLGIDDPLDLDGEIGLNPALTSLAAEWGAGRLAVVEGIGYPNPDLSHFASLAVWWSGDPDAAGGAGWLGRYLDATVGFDDPLAAITIGSGPSAVLAGDASFATSIADASGLQPELPIDEATRDLLMEAWAGFGADTRGPGGATGTSGQTGGGTAATERIRRAVAETVRARSRLAGILSDASAAGPVGGSASGDRGANARARGGAGDLAGALGLAATLAGSAEPPRLIHVRAPGDFDTHQSQAGRYPALMEQLEVGLAGYLSTLEANGASDRTVLMTTSEFGRRAQENGDGTDHGTAAPHLVLGEAVKGGRYGEPPDLGHLDADGNLVHTVDYRAFYATVLEGWLGADPEAVLGAGFDPLPLFA